MKQCTICKEKKAVDNFHKDMSRKDNLCQKCKKCKSEVDKVYSEKNKARRKELRNKMNYYWDNKERFQNYNERRRQLHRQDPRIRLRGGARGRAIEKGIEFDLPTYKDLPECPVECPVLKIPLIVGSDKNSNGGGTDNSPTLDRIDNNKGYIKTNVHIISRKANQMKSNANFKEIEMLYNYMKGLQK